jgi:alpha-L-rhamnosidase
MERTGTIISSNHLLNQLFSNALWGQKSNFLDVPLDCPQRDERLGWTGDAQVFCRTASLNYDTEKFYTKWLADLKADQFPNGGVSHVVPDVMDEKKSSAAWGDAATICPWEVYMAFGNPEILYRQFESMHRWVDFIGNVSQDKYLWTGGTHFGDWLGLDSPHGSYKGASRDDLIASAFYAYSTELLIRAGRVLGKNMAAYEQLYKNIVHTFQKTFPYYKTQTECVLALHFNLAKDVQAVSNQLVNLIRTADTQLQTGFVGTPYLLHALSDHGYIDLAYELLLRTEYPSWLYPITKGATTIWEHWDGIREDGSFWSPDMNSFNHYAYGAVLDWVYGTAAGIRAKEPGYAKATISPHPDPRLGWLKATLKTRHGLIISEWKQAEDRWRYDITTPVDSTIIIENKTYDLSPGSYCFFSHIN